jgi:hypothetical protein
VRDFPKVLVLGAQATSEAFDGAIEKKASIGKETGMDWRVISVLPGKRTELIPPIAEGGYSSSFPQKKENRRI